MKKCITCKIEKTVSEFHKNKRQVDGLQNKCKECCKIRDKKYYLKYGSQKYVSRSSQNRKRNKEFIERYKKIFGKCVDCGIQDWRVLQFDHIKNKKYNVSEMVNGNSIKLIKEEIKKCVVRCANCHQIKTYHT